VAANLRIKLKKVLQAKRRWRWNLDKVKDVMCGMECRCEANLLTEKGKQTQRSGGVMGNVQKQF